jgi:biotin synthase-related radical SAM superfamily protein
MVIQFTLQDLVLFLAGGLGVAIGILLISVLWNVKKSASALRLILETNSEPVKKAIGYLPEIIDNIGQISKDVRETTDKLKVSVPIVLQEVESVTGSAKKSIDLAGVVLENVGCEINGSVFTYKKDTSSFTAYFHIFEEVLKIIYHTFYAKK